MKRLQQALGACLSLAAVWMLATAVDEAAPLTGESRRVALAQGPQGSGAAAVSGDGAEAERIEWGTGYEQWEQTSGYVLSAAHGNRLLVMYVTPAEAAEVYRYNAHLVRQSRKQGYRGYPEGTRIAAASFQRARDGGPGEAGPVFFMRKESPGYDPTGGNWRYAFTRPGLRLLGEGRDGSVAFCKACHASVRGRGFVYAVTQ